MTRTPAYQRAIDASKERMREQENKQRKIRHDRAVFAKRIREKRQSLGLKWFEQLPREGAK